MIYAVTRKSDGAVVYRYQNDVPIEWDGMEFMTRRHFRMGLGFMLSCPPFPMGADRHACPRNFGHPGMGGAVGFADPDRRMSFAYSPNRMLPVADAGPFASALIDAVYTSLE